MGEIVRNRPSDETPGIVLGGVRFLTALALRTWLRLYDRLTIVGRENLPADGSFILVANHASHLDALCLLSAIPVDRLHRTYPAAAADYFCVNSWRAFVAKLLTNALPFDRHSCWHSVRTCDQLLNANPGTILILFPEGTRSGDRELGEFKPGVGLLTAGRDTPVVPCHLAGTHDALPKGSWFPRPRSVRLTIGKPRVYAHLPANRASRRRICRELRDAVIELGQTSLPLAA